MSDKNLFLGDTTYPHDSRAAEWLRSKYGAYRGHHAWRDIEAGFNAGLTLANSNAADRIEQLERDLAEANARLSKLKHLADENGGIVLCSGSVTSDAGRVEYFEILYIDSEGFDFTSTLFDKPTFLQCIDAAIQEGKA